MSDEGEQGLRAEVPVRPCVVVARVRLARAGDDRELGAERLRVQREPVQGVHPVARDWSRKRGGGKAAHEGMDAVEEPAPVMP